MELEGVVSQKIAIRSLVKQKSNIMRNELKKSTQGSEVVDQLFRFWTHFMPYRIQLAPDDYVERAKICVLDLKVIQIKLQSKVGLSFIISQSQIMRTVVFERFNSDRVVDIHCIIA